jgi:hypothetical protein
MRDDANHHALIAGLVVIAKIHTIFRADSIHEGTVDVGAHLSIASNFHVSLRVCDIQDKQTARGALEDVLRLLSSGVERQRNRVSVSEEPDLRELGSPVRANRGERRDGTLEEITVGGGDSGHERLLLLGDID